MLFSLIWIKRKMDTAAQSHLLGRGFSLHHHVPLSWFSTFVRLQAGFLPMFLLTFRPQKPPSLVRQHRVVRTRPDGDSVTGWWSTSWQPAFSFSHCLSAAHVTLCLLWAAVMRDLHPWLVLSASAHLCCRPDSLGESSQYWPEHSPHRGTSEGQAKVARRPENEVKTTRLQSPAGYLKNQKWNCNSWIVGACWRGWEVGRTLMQGQQRVTKHQRKSRCAQCACKWDIKGMDSSHVLQLAQRICKESWRFARGLKASTLLIVLLNFGSLCCRHRGEIHGSLPCLSELTKHTKYHSNWFRGLKLSLVLDSESMQQLKE